MQTRINGKFVQRGYHGLMDTQTERDLYDSIRTMYPQGAEVQIDMTISLLRMRDLCKDEVSSYHSKCDTPLTDDGICPNASNHYVAEEVEA